MTRNVRFTRGDFIEVTAPEDEGGAVYRGVALDTRGHTGHAVFRIEVEHQILHFNLNFAKVERLFSADLARAMTPSDVSAY